jgi:DNA repair exonuclease SbcCD nuclease subunit
MAKIIITADIHNGIHGKLRDTIWAMETISKFAEEHSIKEVLVLGDLFHDRVSLNIEVLNAVFDQLARSKARKQEWLVFCGNHDMFLKNSWSINSLHILKDMITVIEDTQFLTLHNQRFAILPFIHYESDYMEALNKIKNEKTDILLTHIGVNNATLNECFLLKHWSIVNFDNTTFKHVFVGHFHCYQTIGKCTYPGSPIPFRFDEGVVDHGFLVYDTDTEKYEFHNIYIEGKKYSEYRPPDYITIEDKMLKKYIDTVKGNYVRIILNKEYTIDELSRLRTLLMQTYGALQVSWYLFEKDMKEIRSTNDEVKNYDQEKLFQEYVKEDKPDDMKTDLLFKLHAAILREAENRFVEITEETNA